MFEPDHTTRSFCDVLVSFSYIAGPNTSNAYQNNLTDLAHTSPSQDGVLAAKTNNFTNSVRAYAYTPQTYAKYSWDYLIPLETRHITKSQHRHFILGLLSRNRSRPIPIL